VTDGAGRLGGGALPTVGGRHPAGIARNASFLALGQVGTTTLAILFNAALGRGLGARDFGLYFLATSMATFAYVFVEWGQPLVVIRETARQPELAGELLGTALFLRLAAAAAAALPLLLITIVLGYDARTRWLVALYFVATLPMCLSQGFGMVFRGRDRMDREALVSVTNRAIGLVLVMLALARGGGLAAVAVAQFAAGLGALVVAWFLHGRLKTGRLTVTRGMARRLWVGGAPMIAMGAVCAVQPYLDAVILSKLAPADAIGWYGVAKNILGTLVAPAAIVGMASFPQFSRTAAEPSRFREDVRAALRPILLLGALGAAGTFLFAGTAVRVIYGGVHYGPAASILEAFSPGMFLLFVDVLLANVLLAAGKPRQFVLAKVASVAVSTGLDFVCIPWFQGHYGNGGMGVVVAFAVSETVVFAWALALMPPGTLSPRQAFDAAKALAAAAGTVLVIKAMPGLPPAAGIPLSIAVFGGIAFGLGIVRRDDLAMFTAMVRRRKSIGAPRGGG
jgi:O-antigen/teichoic acid export membrane protein